jgi:micrococcal nuclease
MPRPAILSGAAVPKPRGESPPPRRGRPGGVFAVVLALVFAGGYFSDDIWRMATDADGGGGLVALFEPPTGGARSGPAEGDRPTLLRGGAPAEPSAGAGARITRVAAAPGRVAARRFPLCGSGARIDCVVDGDTLWLDGQKIRVADIDTPEVSSPQCAAERRLGERATRRMQALLNAGSFELHADGPDEDRFGRKLRVLVRNGRSLGDTLVAEGLAQPWTGRRESWCG